jgi:hypothetical protein
VDVRIQLVAIGASGLLLLAILELVRRRRLLERYALLWLFSALVLLMLAIWRGFLEDIARVIGVAYPPNALFFIAFAFVLVLLLHFSLAVSRLTDQTKVLAQRLALMEERQRRAELRQQDEIPQTDRDQADSDARFERIAGTGRR